MQPCIEINLCSNVPCVSMDHEGIKWAPERHQITVGLKDAYSSVYKDIYRSSWVLGFYFLEHTDKIKASHFRTILEQINQDCKKRFDIHQNLAEIVPKMDQIMDNIVKECTNKTGIAFTWSSKAIECIKPAQMLDHDMQEYFRKLDNKYLQYNVQEL